MQSGPIAPESEMMEAGKFLSRRMRAKGETNAALMKHGIDDLDDLPQKSIDDVIPIGTRRTWYRTHVTTWGVRADLIEGKPLRTRADPGQRPQSFLVRR